MKNIVEYALILALTAAAHSVSGRAQQSSPSTTAVATSPAAGDSAAPKIQADPAIWVVKGPHATVYLFGTVHAMKPNIAWHTPRVTTAMDASQTLVEEIPNMDPQEQAAKIQPLMQQFGMDPDHPLSTKLTKEDLALLDTAVKEAGLPGESALEPMRPWVANLMVSVLPILKAGYDPNNGLDVQLNKEFKDKGKPLAGLETMEFQIHLFSDMAQAEEVDALHVSLHKVNTAVADLDTIVSAWEKGDVEAIAKIENDSFVKESPELYQTLVVKRNKAWTEKLDAMLKGDGVTFVAVGAAHLAGPDAVVKMLEAKGYTVTRL
jgi:uncharacterized protein YbaP (TraB family)